MEADKNPTKEDTTKDTTVNQPGVKSETGEDQPRKIDGMFDLRYGGVPKLPDF